MAFDVRAATPADRSELAQLVREMIPGVDADARLAWMYEHNPSGRALTWLATEGGEIAGCTSYFPFRLHLDGTKVLAALGGDGYVRPTFRRRGLGGLLHDVARRGMSEHAIQCMYGAPGAMNVTPLKHGGSRQVGNVARWVRPVLPLDRVLPRRAELVPMRHYDPRVDEVWHAFSQTVQLAAVRDATFYTWRFLEAPAHVQTAHVIVAGKRPIGVCALQCIGDALRIVDLVAVPGAWHRCLSAIARYAQNARIVEIKLMTLDGRRRQMWRAGFVERENKPFLVVIPKNGDRRLLDPMRWYFGGADSDVDVLD